MAFDPTRNVFFEAARYQTGGPVLGVIDGSTQSWVQNLSITSNDHSVAVDPITGEVFVAFGAAASNTYCTQGCIGVFAPVEAIPEPATASIILMGLVGFAGVKRGRQGRRETDKA